ncbi:MAG: hypothetical protein JST16_01140 [Bdellovibrionales bacterium]|nr:hypothetical protein [Bdellovibrionales bacterium]
MKFKKVIGLAAVAGLAGGLYACAYDPPVDAGESPKVEHPNASPTPKPAEKPPEKPTLQVADSVVPRATLEELDAPNAYQVHLAWTPDPASSSLVISRENLVTGETLQIITLESTIAEYVDRSVQPKTSYRYHLGRTTTSGFKSEAIEAQIPIDFVVNGNMVVNAVGPEFNRLWMLPNSTLLTQGSDLRIEVNEIIALNNTAIDSAPVGNAAPYNTPGQSGGSITIKAQAATGRLKIFANGQNGGQGAPGVNGNPGGKGPKGMPAETGRESGTECERHCPSHPVCVRQPGNGGQGSQGMPGDIGHIGLQGGDSARVFVAVLNPKDFEVIPTVNPGFGGPGGVGGNGGPGGPGGDPGDTKSPCGDAAPGPVGARGPQGPVGPTGQRGIFQPVCLKLGGSLVGDCNSFADMTQ